jgi:formylglycine-generating enzyme required for sulfatase activity
MHEEARAHDRQILAPGLAMGISERVGTNWFSDTLRDTMEQHNEPFRQQLHPSHPLSSLNPNLARLEDIDVKSMHPYERHWLVTFVASKYGDARQLIKETNLFFAVRNYMQLFSDAPIIVLSRDPIGIASSFTKGNLFDRWGYGERYDQMRTMTERREFSGYRFAVDAEHPDKIRSLGRLIALNTLLLADAIGDRPFAHVPYEAATKDQRATLKSVSYLLFKDDSLVMNYNAVTSTAANPDSTFNTRRTKKTLTADLDKSDIRTLVAEIRTVLTRAEGCVPPPVVERAKKFLESDEKKYTATGRYVPKKSTARGTEATSSAPSVEPQFVEVDNQSLLWRNTLVTNREFCDFINELQAAGLSNVVCGTQLLCNEAMISERGGRIHRDEAAGTYYVDAAYENHPVYWVTWIGAVAFARFAGSQLPMRKDIDELAMQSAIEMSEINADYRVGDATAVAEQRIGANDSIYHLLGNVAIWCQDGPAESEQSGGPMKKYFYGIAWNTPSTIEEARAVKSRHITGSSRGIGIRLVRDSAKNYTPESPADIAQSINVSFEALADRTQPLAKLEAQFTARLL